MDRIRQAAAGEQRLVADRMLYGLLVTLGNYAWEALPLDQQAERMEQLVDVYANDPSSGVHSATGWLLRHWGQEEAVERIDNTPVGYDPQREWFVKRFQATRDMNGDELKNPEPFCITFVVFPSGRFQIGSPETEIDRSIYNEAQVTVTLTRPFAIADREICWRQFAPFDDDSTRQQYARQMNRTVSMLDPSFGVNWYEAVEYCRWLGQVLEMDESEQSYPKPEEVEKDEDGNPRNWPLHLGRKGYRLPTDAEWEIACRGGMVTPYSFGSDRELLGVYNWYQDNSGGWSRPVGQLPPNGRGLFDMHGNLWEWMHDWYGDTREDGTEDPTGPVSGLRRMARGGGWINGPAFCRTAYRYYDSPTGRSANFGFRVACCPTSE